jgi:hypothetical protein
MARRSPGALRANQRPSSPYHPAPRAIPGLSLRVCEAIERLETQRLWRGAVADALVAYRRFLKQPGRYLYLPHDDCPCCDPCTARDTLERAINGLPPHAKRALRHLITRLDTEFRRRTLPDPFADPESPWHAAAWWQQRLRN